MAVFSRKSVWEKEWDSLEKSEAKYTAKRKDGPTSLLLKKLDRVIPKKLSDTMNAAFYKAFEIVFDKGTGVIEKTYNKEKREAEYMVNSYASSLNENKKTVGNFTKKARSSRKTNLLISSAEGVGLGLVGMGIPDIPVFIGMVLKSVYEVALSYGYNYESDEEKIFILRVIEIAMTDEEEFVEKNESFNNDIHQIAMIGDEMPQGSWSVTKDEQIRITSDALSREMIYTKFVQGKLILGVVGGIFDPVYINRISNYAVLKYRRRFLESRMNG